MYKRQNLEVRRRSMPIIAKALARRAGLKLVFERTFAPRTDGKTVFIPSSLPAYGDDAMAEIIEGLVDHECGHCVHTDFSEWDKAKTPLKKRLLNTLEDPRMEGKVIRRYPGSKHTLKKTASYLVDYFSFDPTANPASTLNGWLITNLRVDHLGQDALSEVAKLWKEHAHNTFGSDICDDLYELALESAEKESTRDCRLVVEQICKQLEEYIKEDQQQKQQQSQGQGQSSDQDDDSDGEGQQSGQSRSGKSKSKSKAKSSSSNNQSQDQSNGQGQGQDGEENDQGDDGDSTGQNENSGQEGGSGASSGQSTPDDIAKILEAVLNAGEDEIREFAQVCDHLSEMLKEMGDGDTIEDDRSIDSFKSFRGKFEHSPETLSGARIVSNRLDSLLQSVTLDSSFVSNHGALDTRRVANLSTGRTDIFEVTDYAVGINTAVYLGLDRSGSMTNIQRFANSACGILADVLFKFDVTFGVGAFDDSFYPIKDMDESWVQVGKRLNMVTANGGTCMGSATNLAFEKLVHREETRKIFILITDGCPSSFPALNAAIDEALRYDVEVRAVVIGDKQMSDHFRDQLPIKSVANAQNHRELPQAIFDALKSSLI